MHTTYNSGNLGTGLLTIDRPQKMLEEAMGLVERYPAMCKFITKKGLPDLRLNWRFGKEGGREGGPPLQCVSEQPLEVS